MKDVLFYYIRRNEKVKEFLAPFYKGYIYCKEIFIARNITGISVML